MVSTPKLSYTGSSPGSGNTSGCWCRPTQQRSVLSTWLKPVSRIAEPYRVGDYATVAALVTKEEYRSRRQRQQCGSFSLPPPCAMPPASKPIFTSEDSPRPGCIRCRNGTLPRHRRQSWIMLFLHRVDTDDGRRVGELQLKEHQSSSSCSPTAPFRRSG